MALLLVCCRQGRDAIVCCDQSGKSGKKVALLVHTIPTNMGVDKVTFMYVGRGGPCQYEVSLKFWTVVRYKLLSIRIQATKRATYVGTLD